MIQYKCNITVLYNDTISITDLNRQFYYSDNYIGKYNVNVLRNYLQKHFEVKIMTIKKDIFCIESLNFDLIFCCFDNVESRMQLNYMANLNKIMVVDLRIEGLQLHVKKIDPRHNSACLYCIKDLYKSQKFFNYCSLKI